jgi:hypothetical protein
MIPFQRQVYESLQAKKQEAKQKKMEEARSGGTGGSPRRNSLASSNGSQGSEHSRSETVRYVNDGESDDSDIEFID